MKLQFLVMNEDGEVLGEAQEVWIDGYGVGDRVLEDVMFRLRVNAQGDGLEAAVGKSSAGYFKTLNSSYWLPKIIEYALQQDLFASSEHANDDAIVLYDWDKPYTEQAAHFYTTPEFPEGTITLESIRSLLVEK